MAKSFDELDVARLAGALGVYDETIGLLDDQIRLRMSPEHDNKPLYAIHHRLRQSRYKLAEDYKNKNDSLALDGAISAAMTKKKRARKRTHAN